MMEILALLSAICSFVVLILIVQQEVRDYLIRSRKIDLNLDDIINKLPNLKIRLSSCISDYESNPQVQSSLLVDIFEDEIEPIRKFCIENGIPSPPRYISPPDVIARKWLDFLSAIETPFSKGKIRKTKRAARKFMAHKN